MKSTKLTPKIVLEGTRLTFKTDIAFSLNEHPAITGPKKYKYHSPVISAEWCAFTNYPWGRGLINFNPEEKGKAFETYETWLRLFELQRYYSWIIDRFHLSTLMHQKIYNKIEYDLSWIDKRMKDLNFHLVFLKRSPASFINARTERLKVSGKPAQYDDLSLFIKEQEVMEDLFAKSSLTKIEIDISDNNIGNAVEKIVEWISSTGGLYSE